MPTRNEDDYYNDSDNHDYLDTTVTKTSQSTETSTFSSQETTKNVYTTSTSQIEYDESDEIEEALPVEFNFNSLYNCRFLNTNV